MKIEYSSNNSGGTWWLEDKDWHALEKAGWTVKWRKDEEGLFKSEDGRWLGALATSAWKQFETPSEAMREFEKITGQDVTDEGCNCCGAPHTFYWGRAAEDSLPKDAPYGVASGEGCIEHMFGEGQPSTLREAIEKSLAPRDSGE